VRLELIGEPRRPGSVVLDLRGEFLDLQIEQLDLRSQGVERLLVPGLLLDLDLDLVLAPLHHPRHRLIVPLDRLLLRDLDASFDAVEQIL
jgi:hypothetical protein